VLGCRLKGHLLADLKRCARVEVKSKVFLMAFLFGEESVLIETC
jgi:hypothetical protein